jgi:hypothetical protein
VAQKVPTFQTISEEMHKLAALILTLAGGVSVPFLHHGQTLTRAGVEQALLARENGGPNGHVTSRVECTGLGGNRYRCRLTSVRHTSLDVQVVVHGRTLQASWAPVAG